MPLQLIRVSVDDAAVWLLIIKTLLGFHIFSWTVSGYGDVLSCVKLHSDAAAAV